MLRRKLARRARAMYARTALLAFLGGVSFTSAAIAPNLILVGVEVDDSGANNDGSLEPGETVNLEVELFNDGSAGAAAIAGTLSYLGTRPGVAILDGVAAWPDLAAHGAPALTNPPHFQVQLSSALPCGDVLPFRVEVTDSIGQLFDLDFSIKAGQRINHDTLQDALKRFDKQEANFWGTDPGDQFGADVAVGDVNGDGYADLILGAATANSLGEARVQAGEVYLVYGKKEQWTDTDMAVPPPGVPIFWGVDPGDNFGTHIASGDLNGDGFDDMIISAFNGDSLGNARVDAGEVYVIYGKAASWTDTDLAFPPMGVARFWGAEAGDHLDNVVAADVNHDGFADLIIGAPGAASVGDARFQAGEVYVVYGKALPWGDTDLAAPPPGVTRIWGADPGDGLSVATAGDVNGDGFSDLVLGAWLGDSVGNSRVDAGEAYLIYGQGAQLPDIDLAAPPPGVARFWGADAGDRLGLRAAAGDVNGDGCADIVLGAHLAGSIANSRAGGGEAYLIYGRPAPWTDTDLASPPPDIARIWGAEAGDHLGSETAMGDLNGDGYKDLILAARDAASIGNARAGAGEIYVLYGRATPFSDIDLASPPSGVARFWGADAGDRLGHVAAGDVNGDGTDDLILGAPQGGSIMDTRQPWAGEVYLWYGKATDTYLARQTPIGFIDATSGTRLPLACDDCSTGIPVGFTFPFYGEEFSTLFVSSNGFLSFAPIPGPGFTPACVPSRSGFPLTIDPFWDDLNPGAGGATSGVYALLQGAAPHRRLTIEWKDVPHFPSVGAATFEVTLFESSGRILTQYQDLDFGDPSVNYGARAVVGVQNRPGAQGVAYSCSVNNLLFNGASVSFEPTTPLIENRMESGAGLWDATGPWHLSAGTCEPNQHTGATGWYLGNDLTCGYANFDQGDLRVPTVPSFPADARLAFWSRQQSEPFFDPASVQISTTGTGGLYGTLLGVADNQNAWRYAGVTNLFSNAGDTVDLQFDFHADVSVTGMGWMVDDVQLTGCNASGAESAAEAIAFAFPPAICQGTSGFIDSTGSFCGDGGAPVTFQWKENGAPINGANAAAYGVPVNHVAGNYDYTVAIGCPGGGADESAPAAISIVAPPGAVGPTLRLGYSGGLAQLHFTWSDIASATDYVVFESSTKNGTFSAVTGTAPDGAPGLSIPMPGAQVVYYLVAGRNQACGAGPKE